MDEYSVDFTKEVQSMVSEYHAYFFMIAVLIVFFGVMIRMHDKRDLVSILNIIFLTAFVFFFIIIFPVFFKNSIMAFHSAHEDTSAKVVEFMDNIKDPNVDESWHGIDFSMFGQMFYFCLWSWGYIIKYCMMWLQIKICQLLIIISPLCISFLMVPQLNNVFWKFAQTCLAMCVWLLALDLADVFIMEIFSNIFSTITASYGTPATGIGGVVALYKGTIGVSLLVKIGLIFAFVTTFVYVLVPLLCVAFIRGESITGAVNTARGMAGTVLSPAFNKAVAGMAGKLDKKLSAMRAGGLAGKGSSGGGEGGGGESGSADAGRSESNTEPGGKNYFDKARERSGQTESEGDKK